MHFYRALEKMKAQQNQVTRDSVQMEPALPQQVNNNSFFCVLWLYNKSQKMKNIVKKCGRKM